MSQIQHAFNQAAETYNDHCQLQTAVGYKLINHITNYRWDSPAIIDLGCGTGIVTEQLAKTLAYKEFHATDFAQHLLSKAAERLSPFNIITYFTNFDSLPNYLQPFDLVFSNMALHWSTNFESTLRSITTLLNKNGIIAFSVPLPGTLIELQPHYSINSFMPSKFIINLLENNYHLSYTQQEKFIFPFENTFTALRSIKHVGANTVTKKTKNQFTFSNLNIYQLTYNIGYFIAQKKK